MFLTRMRSQASITLKIWINNKVTDSPMITMCHDKDDGRSASLHPSPITNKEKGVPDEQTIKRSSSLEGQQTCNRGWSTSLPSGKSSVKARNRTVSLYTPPMSKNSKGWWCQVLEKMRFNTITDTLRGTANWLLLTARWCSLAKLEISSTQQLHTRCVPRETHTQTAGHINKNVHSNDV